MSNVAEKIIKFSEVSDGNYIMKALVSLILSVSFGLFGCVAFSEPEITKAEVELLIAQSLSVGSTAEEIEEFLKSNNIQVSFDSIFNRYQANIMNPNKGLPKGFHAIRILIFLDDQKRFLSAEVRDSYTFL